MKKNPTNKEMKELAKQMAHSKDEQSRYNQILRNLLYYLLIILCSD
jgi:hypothetical protein